jgi:hypothetical protein
VKGGTNWRPGNTKVRVMNGPANQAKASKPGNNGGTAVRRFRTARDMQAQIEKLQDEMLAIKQYHLELTKALQAEQERVANQNDDMDELKLKSIVAAKIIRQLTTDQASKKTRSPLKGTPKYNAKENPLNEPIEAYFERGGNISTYIDSKLAAIGSLLEE